MGKNKVVLEFDKEKRADFLTGFQKRKLERRKKAEETLEKSLREEKARIRKEKRDAINSRLEEMTNIKLTHGIETTCVDLDTSTMNLPRHNVTIVESELFDPALNCYMGENDDDKSSDESEENNCDSQRVEKKPHKPFNIGRSMEMLGRMKKKQKTFKKPNPHPVLRNKKKATRKYLRKQGRPTGNTPSKKSADMLRKVVGKKVTSSKKTRK